MKEKCTRAILNKKLVQSLTFLLGMMFFTYSVAYSQGNPFIVEAGSGQVWIYGGGGSTKNYYDVDGDLRLFDSLETRFMALTFGVSFDYGLTDFLELNLDLPIGYFSISSSERFPDRSIFAPVYLGIGGTYQLTKGEIYTAFSTQFKIPPGFHDGIYDDPEHPTFLSDGYFEFTNILSAGLRRGNVWFKGHVGYNWRDEEPLDEIVYDAEIGFSRTEGTGIFLGVGGVQSTGEATEPAQAFYAGASGTEAERARRDGGTGVFRTIDRENNFSLRAGAYVDISKHITLSGQYSLRLFGTNSLSIQGGHLGVGYRF